MERWILRNRFRYRFTKEQRAAIAGKIPMTKELFWDSLNIYWNRYEVDEFWKLWYAHPVYVQQYHEQCKHEMADPTSERRKQADAWWERMRPEFLEFFGAEWVADREKESTMQDQGFNQEQ